MTTSARLRLTREEPELFTKRDASALFSVSLLPLPECQNLTFKAGRWKSRDMNVSLPEAMEESSAKSGDWGLRNRQRSRS